MSRSGNGAHVTVTRAPGWKCARCYRVLPEVGLCQDHPQACLRCVEAITGEKQDVHALAAARFDKLFRKALADGLSKAEAVHHAGRVNRGEADHV